MKNVGNMILKVLKCVRIHPEELLVVKTFLPFFEGFLEQHDENEKFREYHFESSEMCKNSS